MELSIPEFHRHITLLKMDLFSSPFPSHALQLLTWYIYESERIVATDLNKEDFNLSKFQAAHFASSWITTNLLCHWFPSKRERCVRCGPFLLSKDCTCMCEEQLLLHILPVRM